MFKRLAELPQSYTCVMESCILMERKTCSHVDHKRVASHRVQRSVSTTLSVRAACGYQISHILLVLKHYPVKSGGAT
jgi:hypothetical protein